LRDNFKCIRWAKPQHKPRSRKKISKITSRGTANKATRKEPIFSRKNVSPYPIFSSLSVRAPGSAWTKSGKINSKN